MSDRPIYRTFRTRRVMRRNAGMALIVGGLLLMFALPLRLRFPGALWIQLGGSLALLTVGWILFATAYGTPVREVLLLAADKRAALSPADLVTEMELDVENARAILTDMEKLGLLRRADNAEAYLLAGDAPRPVRK